MHVFAFLLAAAGAALSLCYSGCFAMIMENGFELGWLKNFGSLDPKSMCVVVSSALAASGALLLLFRKKLAALLLFAASGICLYCEFNLKIVYPYVRAAAVLFAAAGLIGMKGRTADGEYGNEEYVRREPAMGETAPATAPDREAKEGPAAAEEAPPAETSARSRAWGFLLALAAAGYALWQSGMWPAVQAHFADPAWYGNLAALDGKSLSALAAAALALLGGLLALFQSVGGTLLLTAAAAVCAAAHLHWDPWFPASWGAFVLCLAAAAAAWPGAAVDAARAERRYTPAYVLAFIFALAAVFASLCQSGADRFLLERCRGGFCLAALDGADARTLFVLASAALGLVGGLLALCGLRFSAVLLLTAMFVLLGGKAESREYFSGAAWIPPALYAISALLARALAKSDGAPAKKLPLSAALIAMLLAAAAGGAATWRYVAALSQEKARSAGDNGPAYQQLAEETKAKDAKIAAMDAEVRERMAIAAERDQKIVELTAACAAKDEEIGRLQAQNARLEQARAELAAAQAGQKRKFVYLRGSNNVRDVPNADKGSKVIGRLANEAAEVIGSEGGWYRVKGAFGAGWVFGKNATVLELGD